MCFYLRIKTIIIMISNPNLNIQQLKQIQNDINLSILKFTLRSTSKHLSPYLIQQIDNRLRLIQRKVYEQDQTLDSSELDSKNPLQLNQISIQTAPEYPPNFNKTIPQESIRIESRVSPVQQSFGLVQQKRIQQLNYRINKKQEAYRKFKEKNTRALKNKEKAAISNAQSFELEREIEELKKKQLAIKLNNKIQPFDLDKILQHEKEYELFRKEFIISKFIRAKSVLKTSLEKSRELESQSLVQNPPNFDSKISPITSIHQKPIFKTKPQKYFKTQGEQIIIKNNRVKQLGNKYLKQVIQMPKVKKIPQSNYQIKFPKKTLQLRQIFKMHEHLAKPVAATIKDQYTFEEALYANKLKDKKIEKFEQLKRVNPSSVNPFDLDNSYVDSIKHKLQIMRCVTEMNQQH